MPLTAAGFLALKIKVTEYVSSVSPDTTVSLDWPEQAPTRDEPDFTFVIRFRRREVAVTLSALDVMKGGDWRLQIDDAMNRISQS
ncbi:MAG: hypothetical protein ACREUW_03625 [Burkholderiales bacterium]